MQFRGTYAGLSNMAPCRLSLRGEIYPSLEHAFQAAKTLDAAERRRIQAAPTPAEAKRLGRRVTLRSDWEDIKLTVMLEMLRRKFRVEPYRSLLLGTGEMEIVEENTWNDRFWGVCRGEGQNHLGRLLMQVREELK